MRLCYIQRATFHTMNTKDIKSFTGRNGLISLDYMGSSEYEFGAVPYSFRRIMNEYDQYSIHEISDIKNYNQIPLQVYCKDDQLAEIINELKKFIEQNDPHKISSYQLKEGISFVEHLTKSPKKMLINYGDDFWWDLKNDFFFFFAKPYRVDQVNYALQFDYDNWWMAHDEARRNELLMEAKTKSFI